MRTLPIVVLILVAASAHAGPAVPEGVLESIRSEDLARHIEVLASDEFEGREPGTPGQEKTLRYLGAAFRRIGVEAGTPTGYLQRVPLVEVRGEGAPEFSMAGGTTSETFAFGEDFVPLAGKPAKEFDLRHLPLVFAGHGITAEEFGWDDYAGAGVDGAAVMLLRGEPAADSTLFRGRALTVHGLSSTKYENAARRGARAAIVVHTEASAGYPWSVMTGGGLGGSQHFLEDAGADALDLAVHLNEPAARRLLAAAGADYDTLVERASRAGFSATPLGLTVSAAARFTTRDITSYNVVARIEGREAPQECVLYTAHWDHVGRNDELAGDPIFNGAVDNATGTAGLLEIAEAFVALPQGPRRTVLFVATTAEEKGLLGSEYLARNPLVPLAATVGVINLDALFPFGAFGAMTVTALGSSEIEDVLAESAAKVGRVLQDDGAPEAGAFYRSDHYPFAKRGVPALFAVGNPRPEEAPEGSEMAARFAAYLADGYHKPGDEYDAATWDLRGVETDVRVLFETGWCLAEDVRFPNWRYGHEFRALRDRMRASLGPSGRTHHADAQARFAW
ncbi:MAG: M28 family peptidase [Candidatus Eiseniibacteriota bacterium]